ncbi:MAG: C40 family peptidase [Candidatus Pacebacteria bacterium]|nr:C40 family peptidase [Candidatus Paceibacterota bacterium]MBP9866501.1 C40 family peptidase [Candidatus Paceibacterota bacterium]
MKFSKNWLQDYIDETLPSNEVIADTLNKKAFEVEEVITLDDDTVFDIKILPNRAHDALGHHGMAYELCSCFGFTFKPDIRDKENDTFLNKHIPTVVINIENEKACTRFMSVQIDGVTVGESPVWLRKRLEAIGQRSINNIVDITNYVQFALNKPMHAYDARRIQGGLIARFARASESLMTLDDKSIVLDEQTLVIADDEKVLGLAGIKGGKFSGIQADTTSVILESANFDPVLIRKTAQKYNLKTDASKRFENGIANNLIVEGLHMTANLIQEVCKEAKRGLVTDVYPKKDTPYFVGISKNELNAILGTSYTDEDIQKTLVQLSLPFEIIIPETYIKETYPTLVGAGYKNPSSMREDAPRVFSCSSLISYLYKGIWMPSVSIDKYVFSKKISKEELQFGDLVFANSGEGKIRYESVEFLRGTKVPEGVDHVAMYIGDNTILHATKIKEMTLVESFEEFAAGRTIVGYGRIVEDLKEERYVVRVPSVRLDIRIKEDVAEEIGRILGYEKLVPVLPRLNHVGLLHKRMYYENKIREILVENEFSEVITYTFGNEGDVAIVKGLADDKEKLRNSLSKGLLSSLALNLYNAPLLGQKTIQLFEFGNVFTIDQYSGDKRTSVEKRYFGLAIDDGAKKSSFTENVEMMLSAVKRALGVKEIEYTTISAKPYVIELDFDTLIAQLPEPSVYEKASFVSLSPVSYKSVSSYPFITRDIAVWVPDTVTWESIYTICNKVGNPLARRIDLFDTFSKEIEGVKKTSYAFRLVFQSYEKTLTDEEVNEYMEPYYTSLKKEGYEIR